jgi:hypothetical protein
LSTSIFLLGIDTGHLTITEPVRARDGSESSDLVVLHNTGMAIVCPAWAITELLMDEALVTQRRSAATAGGFPKSTPSD